MASISFKTTDNKEYDYGAFTQREEAYSILLHLWQNVPSYTVVPENDMNPKSPRVTDTDNSMFNISLTQERGHVDVDSARNGLRKLHQAKDMGLATLDELDRQREVVHSMHQRLEDMDVDLARNERHIRGIESIPGAIANKIVKDKSMANRKEIVFEAREHKIEAAKKADKDVEILYKFNTDKLLPALLVFKEKVFVCSDANVKTKLIEKGAQWEYSDVKLVLIRARHQHMDVWFKGGGKEKRIRFMTAHIQWITNEFGIRCGPELDVQWEPGAKKFDYGSVELAQRPPPRRGKEKESGYTGGPVGTSNLISKTASKQTHQALAQQDAYLDEMSHGLDELIGISDAIGTEVEASTREIRAVNNKLDDVTVRVEKQNKRVEKLIK